MDPGVLGGKDAFLVIRRHAVGSRRNVSIRHQDKYYGWGLMRGPDVTWMCMELSDPGF